jgi:membrane protein implicated in regulation of membrane protease activity
MVIAIVVEGVLMNWSEFYFVCFLVGFLLSVVSLLAGSVHLHLPHLHLHGGHFGHAHGHGANGGASWFNLGTLAAFLAWFGGTGYLLEHYYTVWYLVALGIATLSGIGGASVIFWFLSKLVSREQPLDPADYEMVGVLGKLTMPIRAGGTGELVYTQGGTRRVTGARAESGAAISKGVEVVVTRYEKGIAYVRAWDELTGDTESSQSQSA